jgi:leucyl/phenylalanyl-tRNA--protein transferase
VTIAVARKQIAALFGWHLSHSTEERVVECLGRRAKLHTNPASGPGLESTQTTSPVVAVAADVFPRTFTRVSVRRCAQGRKGLLVDLWRVALPQEGLASRVRLEAEPCEILEKSDLILGTTADSIVVFQAKQHAAAECARNAPNVDRIDDMTEMEITSGRWREARQGQRAQRRGQPCEIRLEWRIDNQEYVIPFLSSHDPFPPVDRALQDPNGLLAAGGDLSPERLLDAYVHGIFPWFGDDDPVLWWSPDPRMVLFTAEVHVSRSLRKRIRSGRMRVTLDSCFKEVMDGCAAPRRGQDGTWITDEMTEAYLRLFELGYAHSVEAWEDDTLIGGLYGVSVGRMFYGESMFSRVPDASKVALVSLVTQIGRWGFPCVDCQMSTGHLSSLGAREIPRATFLRHVRSLVRQPAVPSPWRFDTEVLRTLALGSPL